ncbi:hypothetical protein MMPV_002904 [Pyropia vietnamensis]
MEDALEMTSGCSLSSLLAYVSEPPPDMSLSCLLGGPNSSLTNLLSGGDPLASNGGGIGSGSGGRWEPSPPGRSSPSLAVLAERASRHLWQGTDGGGGMEPPLSSPGNSSARLDRPLRPSTPLGRLLLGAAGGVSPAGSFVGLASLSPSWVTTSTLGTSEVAGRGPGKAGAGAMQADPRHRPDGPAVAATTAEAVPAPTMGPASSPATVNPAASARSQTMAAVVPPAAATSVAATTPAPLPQRSARAGVVAPVPRAGVVAPVLRAGVAAPVPRGALRPHLPHALRLAGGGAAETPTAPAAAAHRPLQPVVPVIPAATASAQAPAGAAMGKAGTAAIRSSSPLSTAVLAAARTALARTHKMGRPPASAAAVAPVSLPPPLPPSSLVPSWSLPPPAPASSPSLLSSSSLPPVSSSLPLASSSLPPPAQASSSLPPPAPASSSLPPPAQASSSLPPPAPASSSLPPPAQAPSSLPPPAPASSSLPPPAPAPSSLPPPAPTSSSLPPPAPASSSLPPVSSSLPPASSSLPPPPPASSSLPSPPPASSLSAPAPPMPRPRGSTEPVSTTVPPSPPVSAGTVAPISAPGVGLQPSSPPVTVPQPPLAGVALRSGAASVHHPHAHPTPHGGLGGPHPMAYGYLPAGAACRPPLPVHGGYLPMSMPLPLPGLHGMLSLGYPLLPHLPAMNGGGVGVVVRGGGCGLSPALSPAVSGAPAAKRRRGNPLPLTPSAPLDMDVADDDQRLPPELAHRVVADLSAAGVPPHVSLPALARRGLGGTTSSAARRMSPEERTVALYCRRLRNRRSAKRSRAARLAALASLAASTAAVAERAAAVHAEAVAAAAKSLPALQAALEAAKAENRRLRAAMGMATPEGRGEEKVGTPAASARRAKMKGGGT